MIFRASVAALAALVCLSVIPGASAQSNDGEERYVVLVEGDAAGHVRVTTQGQNVAIDYMVSNNGRGPRLRQNITLGNDGLPRAWRIEGNSAFGGPVQETFTQTANRANWSSQADEGAADVDHPMLYVANDDTPWGQSLYARALLNDPNRELDVLPGGAIRLEEVRRISFGTGARRGDAIVYRLIGLGLAPGYFLLDSNRRLLATVSSGDLTVREGYEDQEDLLHDLSHALESEYYRALQQRVAHRMDAPVRIRNVRVFDPASGQVGPLSAVTYFDDVITSVETQGVHDLRADAYNVDGQGGVLVPGLHDMHAHVSPQSAFLYLSAGVTSVRDMGNDGRRLSRLIDDIEAGAVAGPRIVPNGIIEGRSPYSDRDDVVADSLEEAIEGVRWYAAHGYWQIKIYNSLHPEWMRPVVEEAHRLGMTVTGHVPAFVTADEAIEAGYDDIAHTNQLMLGWLMQPGEDTRTAFRVTALSRAADLDLNSRPVRHTINLMRRNDVALDTTLVIGEALLLGRARQTPSAYAGFLDHMPIGYRRAQMRTSIPINSAEEDARYRAGFERVLQTIGLLHRRGVQLLPSTDQGSGFSLHRELELYVAAGIPAAETLSLATLRAEQYLRRDQRLGSIERGKLADFLLIPNDPTVDVGAIRQIRMVVRDGVIYFPSEMHAALGIRPFAEAVEIEAPAVRDSRPDPGEAHEG